MTPPAGLLVLLGVLLGWGAAILWSQFEGNVFGGPRPPWWERPPWRRWWE